MQDKITTQRQIIDPLKAGTVQIFGNNSNISKFHS
jgi:hypothetical protein